MTSHKFPIIATREDGRCFRLPVAAVQRGLGTVSSVPVSQPNFNVDSKVMVRTMFGKPRFGIVIGNSPVAPDRKIVLTVSGKMDALITELTPVVGKRPEADIMSDFISLYSALSPENLTCDGELSRVQVARRGSELNAMLRALSAEFGRTVSESEAYAWERTGKRAAT